MLRRPPLAMLGGHPPQAEQSKVNLPALPSPPPLVTQPDHFATLAQQVQDLVAVVRELQEQHYVATQQQPPPSPPQAVGPQASQQSTSGRLPSREPNCHVPPRPHRRKASKRPRSPTHHSRSLPKRRHGKEPERRHHHQHCPSSYSSSESSGERPFDSRVGRWIERQLDEYNQQLEELSHRITYQPEADYDSWPPLTHCIMEEPILTRFRLPQLDPYDGTTDPLDHLESYNVLMQVQGATDALLCVAFLATLRKAMRAWYSRLPPRSINSFRQLERAFLAHFDACQKIPCVADNLFSFWQKDGESLKDFVSHFKAAALEVDHLDDSVATLVLNRGLRPSRFTYSFDKKPSVHMPNF